MAGIIKDPEIRGNELTDASLACNVAAAKGSSMRKLTMLAAALLPISMASESAAWCYGIGAGANHPNGGGWVQASAQVADTVYVGPKSSICEGANVSDNVALYGRSAIAGQATVSDNVVVRGQDSFVGGDAIVSGNATVLAGANIFDSAAVSGNVIIRDKSFIFGSATVYGNATIMDGAPVFNNAEVYGSAKVKGRRTHVKGDAEIFGNAVVRSGAWITGNGRVDCGIWKNITVSTNRAGQCGRNGKTRGNLIENLIGEPLTPIDIENTQSTN